jgi:CRP/FNR family transcriptional regulator, cyclic AMP receptor protein
MMQRLNLFAPTSDFEYFPAGEVVFSEGDPGDVMYVVQEGEVDILLGGRVIETVRAGGVVGELAMIDNSPRSATVVARSNSRLVPIDEKRFAFLVQYTPNFANHVMQIMSERIRMMDTLVH